MLLRSVKFILPQHYYNNNIVFDKKEINVCEFFQKDSKDYSYKEKFVVSNMRNIAHKYV